MKYLTHETNEKGWTPWIRPNPKLYRLSCCDCGLVHDFKFKEEAGIVFFKARRNNRATGQKRRYKKGIKYET